MENFLQFFCLVNITKMNVIKLCTSEYDKPPMIRNNKLITKIF